MSHLVKRGTHEYYVFVESLAAGGFTFSVLDRDLSKPTATETTHESNLVFETEKMAYLGGIANARKRAKTQITHH